MMSIGLHAACAGIYLVTIGFVALVTRAQRSGRSLALACFATFVWAAGVAAGAEGLEPRAPAVLELVEAAAWYGYVVFAYHRWVPDGSRLRQPLSLVGVLSIAVGLASLAATNPDSTDHLLPSLGIDARLALAVSALLLIENIYRNVAEDLRWHVTLPCVALGGMFVYDVVLYSDAALFRRLSPALADGRVVVAVLIAPLLAIAALRERRSGNSLQVSHRAVFYSASLVVVGIFLLALAATGELLREFGPGRGSAWGILIELSLLCAGILAAAVFFTSGSARARLRHLVINNFLLHRYDYRVEWLRCIATLSQADEYVPLHTRVIKAVATTVDSPAGMAFLREPEDGVFRWVGSWNLPPPNHAISQEHPLISLFRGGRWIVEAPHGSPWVEGWASGLSELWLAVPLSHAGRLLGFILVARPRAHFVLDSEVFALLRIVGQEVASFVAEQRAAEVLLQTRQLREYGQRFAFVAHDVKNVASQLSLLLANAEHHLSNPEFQRDMLATVGASVAKINSLLTRLKAPAEQECDTSPAPDTICVSDHLRAVVDACPASRRERIQMRDKAPPDQATTIAMAAPAFAAVVTHLLNNAFEASEPGDPVRIECHQTPRRALIDITDQGCGMTQEFIREQLFQPFRSSKQDGFGIGVYQARELLRRAGGDLIVTSAPGAGTTMRVSLPLATALVAQLAPVYN